MEIGSANERCSLPLLIYQAYLDHFLKMMGKCGRCCTNFVLKTTHGKPDFSGPNERTVDRQARRIAKCFKLGGSINQFHVPRLEPQADRVNYISRIIEIYSKQFWRKAAFVSLT